MIENLTVNDFISQGYFEKMYFKTLIRNAPSYMRTILNKALYAKYKSLIKLPCYDKLRQKYYIRTCIVINNPDEFVKDWNTRLDSRFGNITSFKRDYLLESELHCYQRNYKCEGCYNNEFSALKDKCKLSIIVIRKLNEGIKIPNRESYIDNEQRIRNIRWLNNE